MRPWAWVRRVLALAVTFVFVLGILVTPAFAAAKGRSFSAPKSGGFSSGGRSFSAPKPSTSPKTTTPSSPSRSFSSPKPSTTTPSSPSRSFSSPPPSSTSQPSKGYSSPSQGYTSGDRSYSSPDRSFSSQRPTTPSPSSSGSGSAPLPTPPSYDTGKTRYPSYPPVVIYGPSPFDAPYWHDWYYGRPFWWRMWHRPVYYGTGGGWAINWWPVIILGGIGLWFLLGVLSAYTTRRRRH